MRVLYVIFVLCVGALLWAAVAAARHIRRHEGVTARRRNHQDQKQWSASELPDDPETLVSAQKMKDD